MHKLGPEKHPWGIWQDSGSAPNQSPRAAPPDRGKPHGHGPSPILHLTCQVTSVTALTTGLPPVGTGRQWVGWGGWGMPQRVRLNLLLVLWRLSHSFLTVKDTWLYCTPILWRPWCISLYSFCLFMNTFVLHFPHSLFLLLLFCFRIYFWKRILSLAGPAQPAHAAGRGCRPCAARSQWTTLLQSHGRLLRFAFSGNTPAATFFFFNSLSRMLGVITFMHICLTSMFLSSGPKELVGSVQIPNSRVFQSLPFIWIVYQIILLLSMAQVMFTSKHVYKQLLHVKYSGFP